MSNAPVLAVHIVGEQDEPWVDALAEACQDWRIMAGRAITAARRGDVRVTVVWEPSPGFLGGFPALERIVSVGTGLDHLRRDPSRPSHVPVFPRRDPGDGRIRATTGTAASPRLGQALFADRLARRWLPVARGPLAGTRVSILGSGPMAQGSADLFAQFCYVTAWSRTGADAPDRDGTIGVGPPGRGICRR